MIRAILLVSEKLRRSAPIYPPADYHLARAQCSTSAYHVRAGDFDPRNMVAYGLHTRKAFLFGLCAGLFFAPYALTAHYILLIPALATLSDKNILIGAIVYPTTLIPLLRLRFGFNVAPLDAIYPLALLILLWFVLKNETVYNDGNYGRTAKTIPYPKNL